MVSALFLVVIPELCENQNGGCQHYCKVKRGNVECSCADGYVLDSDDKSCSSNGEKVETRMEKDREKEGVGERKIKND